jgi:threonine dehydrogenase-like Zn-dependent dehydrogenase
MEAFRLHGVGDLRLCDEPMRTPAQDEALVRVTAGGLCGSDLPWLDEGAIGDARLSKPLVLGHDFADATADDARVVLVGISADDRTAFTASVARRKGLTIKLSRRMKHTYPPRHSTCSQRQNRSAFVGDAPLSARGISEGIFYRAKTRRVKGRHRTIGRIT